MENMEIWDALKQPPSWALKEIEGGRLKGKTAINPQWRYQAITEHFGPCGVGWKYEVVNKWTEDANEGQVVACVDINFYFKHDGEWSDPIPSTGGAMLVEQERNGLHVNDEAYKMALTDALSAAMKMIGVASDIYADLWDGQKYREIEKKSAGGGKQTKQVEGFDMDWLKTSMTERGIKGIDLMAWIKATMNIDKPTITDAVLKMNSFQRQELVKYVQNKATVV
ncbi:MAG: hypothetical protein A2158_01640 [Chloroflexi bacterium RBG_13_46_14]|nr:MAG: hypothetical protein A2158_01640 [Chloroflexi bacterium RBG_13_46_14]